MCNSMTGYGRADFSIGDEAFIVEVKTLNHRYLDTKIRMPERFFSLEVNIREDIKKAFARGHVSVMIKSAGSTCLPAGLNRPLVEAALKAAGELSEMGVAGELDLSTIMRMHGIMSEATSTGDNNEDDWPALKSAVNGALVKVAEWRLREGGELKEDIITRLAFIEDKALLLEAEAPRLESAYREKLADKIRALVGKGVDETRLLTEAAIAAEKSAFDEEITRLKSHLARFADYLIETEPVGRRLDFLCQEILREVNTTGSKVSDVSVTQVVVEIKGELEKIREQVQNIE